MTLIKRVWLVLLLSALALSACGAETSTPDPNVILTEGVGTMVAAFFETQTAIVTPPSQTPTASQTPFPTVTSFVFPTLFPTASSTLVYIPVTVSTPTPTGTFYTSTPNPGSLASGCNNLAFIRDVTIPAGTVLDGNQNFAKTWKVQNTGTCDWMYHYSIVHVGGDILGDELVGLNRRVTVNDWSEISVDMTSPRSPGTYTSYWRMADADGNLFGATLVVTFKVGDPPTATPTP